MKTVIALAVFALAGAVATAASAQSARQSGTYVWHGELVSLDESASTATIKARLVGDSRDDVKRFAPGTPVILHWSGFDIAADGIRGVRPFDAEGLNHDPFLFPAELVTPEIQHDYLTIRLRVPDASADALTALEPGEWVTVTARHRPASEGEAIVAVKPYVTAPGARATS